MQLKFFNNLTTLYRPNTLNEVLGQDMNIKFLQNSLYKNLIYPVYIFAGQMGTGKTSTARIFALSYLCEKYKEFNALNINILLPCKKCESCIAFINNKHPDIIELDAASNNGIDTIRAIIDHASLLPVIGIKKFFIIDEVHMLSKAAFNACLKIMEEPPAHVSFILATTEFHKIIDTIKSRGITLYFKPVKSEIIYSNLLNIAKKEKISIDLNAIELLSNISDGSIRDSLNHLELLRMMSNNITIELVNSEIGRSNITLVNDYLKHIIENNEKEYNEFKILFSSYYRCPRYFWTYCVKQLINNNLIKSEIKILKIIKLFYEYEDIFFNTSSPIGILDIIFYEINNKNDGNNNKNNNNINSEDKLLKFINLTLEQDKAIGSIFQQSILSIDNDSKLILCTFKECFKFYKDFINEKSKIINNILESCFGHGFLLKIIFVKNDEKIEIIEKDLKKNIIIEEDKINYQKIENKANSNYVFSKQFKEQRKLKKIDAGPLAIKIMEKFPGITYYVD